MAIIDLEREEILEISGEVTSPPYLEPEKVTIRFSRESSDVELDYSGLTTQGQRGRTRVRRKPDKKLLPGESASEIIDRLARDDDWYAERPAIVPHEATHATLRVRTRSTLDASAEERLIAVSEQYFDDEQRLTEFRSLIHRIGAVFGVRLSTRVPHYD